MSNIILKQGDCLELMKELPDESVDAVITDPLYFLPATHYQTRMKQLRNFADLGILEHFFKDFFEEVKRIVKPDGVNYIFCDGQSYPLFYFYLYKFTKSVRPLVWDKKTSINGYSWRHQHEIIIFGEMPDTKPVPSGDGDILRYSAVKIENRQHPAEKPIKLLETLIKKSTTESDTILDPFMGSGTTGVACQQLNRNFIGYEISPDYFKIAEKRINEAKAQKKLGIYNDYQNEEEI